MASKTNGPEGHCHMCVCVDDDDRGLESRLGDPRGRFGPCGERAWATSPLAEFQLLAALRARILGSDILGRRRTRTGFRHKVRNVILSLPVLIRHSVIEVQWRTRLSFDVKKMGAL